MTPKEEAAAQLADEIGTVLWGIQCLGVHSVDRFELVGEINAAARAIVDQLAQDEDDNLSAQTCIDVMNALWPHGSPEDVGQADWWRTPLGRLCGRSLGRDDGEAVTRAVAAAMLGVHPGTVDQLMHRGTLDRHPDGGVLRASVLRRINR